MTDIKLKKAQLQQVSSKIHVASDEYRYLEYKLEELKNHLASLRTEQKALAKEIENGSNV